MSAETEEQPVARSGRPFYEWLVRRHAQTLFGTALRLCGDRASADDIVQDTFLEAWKGLHSLRQPERARGWLFGILRHRYARWVRGQKHEPRPVADATTLAEMRVDPGPDVVRLLGDRELVAAAMATVDGRFREALTLVYAEGLSADDVATVLGIPRNTALSRLHRGREALRGTLRRLDEERR